MWETSQSASEPQTEQSEGVEGKSDLGGSCNPTGDGKRRK